MYLNRSFLCGFVSTVVKTDGLSWLSHTVTGPTCSVSFVSRKELQPQTSVTVEAWLSPRVRHPTATQSKTKSRHLHIMVIQLDIEVCYTYSTCHSFLSASHLYTWISLRLVPMQRILPSPLQHRQEMDRVGQSDDDCPDGVAWSKWPTTHRVSEFQR